MPQPMGFHLRLGWSGWLALGLALGLLLAIAAAIAVVLVAVLIILLPVVVVAALVYFLFPGLRYKSPGGRLTPDIIEGEYRIVVPPSVETDRPREEP
jgi:hypothetical protein